MELLACLDVAVCTHDHQPVVQACELGWQWSSLMLCAAHFLGPHNRLILQIVLIV